MSQKPVLEQQAEFFDAVRVARDEFLRAIGVVRFVEWLARRFR